MANFRISVCDNVAARCGSVSAISFRICTDRLVISFDCILGNPYRSIALANAAFASCMTGSSGYIVSSKSNVNNPNLAFLLLLLLLIMLFFLFDFDDGAAMVSSSVVDEYSSDGDRDGNRDCDDKVSRCFLVCWNA